jgi:hypothetical protein
MNSSQILDSQLNIIIINFYCFFQWLNDVLFGSVNAVLCVSNSKYQVMFVLLTFYVSFKQISLLPITLDFFSVLRESLV